MYIQILRQASQMQRGISKDIFNTNHSLPQLVLITWFLPSQVWMLLFKLPLFNTVAAHTNCRLEQRDCFLLQRPPRSALCWGLLALASWGSPPSPRRADGSSLRQRQLPLSNQWGQWETLIYYFACSLHTWSYLSHRLFLLLNDHMSCLRGRTSTGFSLLASYVNSTAFRFLIFG